jgi:hypothetical protein
MCQCCGSGSFYQQAKKVRKTLITFDGILSATNPEKA